MDLTIIGGYLLAIAGISTAIFNGIHQSKKSARESERQGEELNNLEHKLILEITDKYQSMLKWQEEKNASQELRISRLEQQLREQREHYEEQLDLKQLEIASLSSQLAAYDRTMKDQKKQIDELYKEIMRLRNRIRELEGSEDESSQS